MLRQPDGELKVIKAIRSRASCVHGGHRRLLPPMGILFFHPSRRRAVFPLRVCFRRRSSATGGKESWSAHRGRAEVWTSQLASQPKQLVGEQGEVEPKTVQGILRHAKIQTTLDLYAQDDGDETRAAQGEYLTALGVSTQIVQ